MAAVRLVIADVDGTLLTPDKILTSRARAAVHALAGAGIAFTITSGRPPARHEDADRRSFISRFPSPLSTADWFCTQISP